MYSEHNPAALEAQGLTLNDVTADVWPENWQTYLIFVSMSSQWRIGMHGPTGLDYSAMPFVFRMHGVKRQDWPEMYTSMRIMEASALEAISSRKEDQ